MKRSLLALFLVAGLVSASFAQMQKDSWMLDGQFGLSLGKANTSFVIPDWTEYDFLSWQNTFSVKPAIGYFVQDNLAFGVSPVFGVGWNNSQQSQTNPANSNSFIYGLGIFLRKYIPAGEKLSFYGELRTEGIWTNTGQRESSGRTVYLRSKSFQGSANLGVQYLVSKNLGILLQTPVLEYAATKTADGDGTPNQVNKKSSLEMNLLSSFQIGASLFF